MNRVIKFFCLIGHWLEATKSRFQKPTQSSTKLSEINKMLLASINQSTEYWQLEVCEKYFKEYVFQFRKDNSIETFKTAILSQMQHQRTSIQIRENKLLKKL